MPTIDIAKITIPVGKRSTEGVFNKMIDALNAAFKGTFDVSNPFIIWNQPQSISNREEVGQYAEEISLFIKGYCAANGWHYTNMLSYTGVGWLLSTR